VTDRSCEIRFESGHCLNGVGMVDSGVERSGNGGQQQHGDAVSGDGSNGPIHVVIVLHSTRGAMSQTSTVLTPGTILLAAVSLQRRDYVPKPRAAPAPDRSCVLAGKPWPT
jgi:hypothetical protein